MIIVQIAGRLGKDAETRFTQSGQKVTTLRMATSVRKGGKEETVWWRVTIWGERYDKMLPYFKKGSALVVVGEMGVPEIWTDKDGRPQTGLELTADIIRFNPFGGSGSEQRQEGGAASPQGSPSGYGNNAPAAYGNSAPAANHQPSNSNYGSHGDDFGGSTQGQGQHYSQSHQSEEPIPF